MLSMPFDAIRETDVIELVGADEEVNTSDFGGSVEVDVSPGPQPASGEFLSFVFIATESGGGAVQDSAGKLLILDADPAVAVGDTALTAAEWATVIGYVDVDVSDWVTDANGGVAYIANQLVPFHNVENVYFVWYHEDSTDLNDGAGDDEVLQVNAWYRRYS
jgi:hypothetical protein